MSKIIVIGHLAGIGVYSVVEEDGVKVESPVVKTCGDCSCDELFPYLLNFRQSSEPQVENKVENKVETKFEPKTEMLFINEDVRLLAYSDKEKDELVEFVRDNRLVGFTIRDIDGSTIGVLNGDFVSSSTILYTSIEVSTED